MFIDYCWVLLHTARWTTKFSINSTIILGVRKWLMLTLHCLTWETRSHPEVTHWYEVNNQTPCLQVEQCNSCQKIFCRRHCIVILRTSVFAITADSIQAPAFVSRAVKNRSTCHSFSFFLASPERTIEDHESVMEVLSGWGMDTDSRLYFRKNYAKYEFFRKPLVSLWWNRTHTHNFTFGTSSLWTSPPVPPSLCGMEEFFNNK